MATASVLGTIVVLPILFVLPGWLVLRRLGASPLIALYCGLGVTAAYGGAVVGLGVLLPWSVRSTCVGGLVFLVLASIYCALTAPRPLLPAKPELAGMVIFVAAFLAAAAFVAVPSRPAGVWSTATVGPGRVDTPRWAGLPSDNTLPYRAGQVAFYKQSGQLRDRFSTGWWISDRTPLVGLDFAFTVGALDAHMRSQSPELGVGPSVAMQIKDPFAFWLYNLVSVLAASAVVAGVFLLALVWRRSVRIATVAALVASLAPGLFLNEIYTWPKGVAAYFVLVALALALRRRPAGAGAFVALGYLCHPAAAFWIPSVLIVLLTRRERGDRVWPSLARFVAGVVPCVLPWQVFTTLYMHAFSKWLFWPFGATIDDRTHFGKALSQAWHVFVQRGIAGDVWVRVESTASSIFPIDLDAPGVGDGLPRFTDAKVHWAAAHGFSIWGMLGVVLFPATVLFMARVWGRDRSLVLQIVVPYVVIAILAAGFPDTWSSQSAYPLVGLLAIFSAEMLVSVSRRTRWWLWAAIAFELLTTAYVCEYAPYNAGVGTIALFAVLGVGAHLGLIAGLGRAIGLGPPSALRRASRHTSAEVVSPA